MNKLSKKYTTRFFKNPEDYNKLKAHWGELMRTRTEVPPECHLLYLCLMGKDWRKGFTPISNTVKVANGAAYNSGLYKSLSKITNAARLGKKSTLADDLVAPIAKFVDLNALTQVSAYLPTFQIFLPADGGFILHPNTVEAYNVPLEVPLVEPEKVAVTTNA